ncbi:serine/threonine-protein kinase [Streptomyces sp. NPDC005892]|uniref:serine/threonine-protein kinase n=1 Tax=Streptomyces sp. NPDC005892 TaxID=3155593 RepID=UPI0033CDD799
MTLHQDLSPLEDSVRATPPACSAEVLGGRYRVEELLGSGATAYVHRGFDLRLRRPVAIKIFRPDTAVDAEENLHEEASILARLHHPGLVTAYDTGRHDDRAFLVMRLVEGETLRDRVARGPLSPAATAAIGAGVAEALAHVHEAGIVHRDVKPSNILLDATQRPCLVDFGISGLPDASARSDRAPIVGTASYLAPEHVLGRPVGRAGDVYALGLVLLECLTGRVEYDGAPIEAAIARVLRPPVFPAWLPEPLLLLLRDMTSPDEEERPTARTCARALSALADGAPVGVVSSAPAAHAPTHGSAPRQPGTPTGLRRTVRRGRLVTAGAGVVMAAVVATAFTVTGNSGPQEAGRSPAGNAVASTGTSKSSEGAEPRKADAAPAPPSAPRPPGGGPAERADRDGSGTEAEQSGRGDRASGTPTAAAATAGTAATGTATTSPAAATRGGPGPGASHLAPGQVKKAAAGEGRGTRPTGGAAACAPCKKNK